MIINPKLIAITVVFSPSAREIVEKSLFIEEGTTALNAANLAANLGEMGVVGVWGKRVDSDYVLKTGDRLEIYRPLTVDPKIARRERFVKQGAKKAGLFRKKIITDNPAP